MIAWISARLKRGIGGSSWNDDSSSEVRVSCGGESWSNEWGWKTVER
jgi:hypothetical protein